MSHLMSMPFQGDSLQFLKNNIFSEGAAVAVPRPGALPHFMGSEVQPASQPCFSDPQLSTFRELVLMELNILLSFTYLETNPRTVYFDGL